MFAKRTVVEYSLFQTADKQRTKKTDDTSPKKKEVKLPIHGKKKLQKNKEVKLPIYGKRKLHEEYRSLTSEIREEKLRTFVNLLKEQISTALKIRQSSLVPKECLLILKTVDHKQAVVEDSKNHRRWGSFKQPQGEDQQQREEKQHLPTISRAPRETRNAG